jgi:hypothetical protein
VNGTDGFYCELYNYTVYNNGSVVALDGLELVELGALYPEVMAGMHTTLLGLL